MLVYRKGDFRILRFSQINFTRHPRKAELKNIATALCGSAGGPQYACVYSDKQVKEPVNHNYLIGYLSQVKVHLCM